MRGLGLGLVLACAATGALAQGVRDGDTLFETDGLAARLSGMMVEFFDGSRAYYGAAGAYEYRYTPEDPPFIGTYETRDSMVCVTFENGADRCDTFVEGGGRLVLIIEDGTRFPVRSEAPWDGGS